MKHIFVAALLSICAAQASAQVALNRFASVELKPAGPANTYNVAFTVVEPTTRLQLIKQSIVVTAGRPTTLDVTLPGAGNSLAINATMRADALVVDCSVELRLNGTSARKEVFEIGLGNNS